MQGEIHSYGRKGSHAAVSGSECALVDLLCQDNTEGHINMKCCKCDSRGFLFEEKG